MLMAILTEEIEADEKSFEYLGLSRESQQD